MKRRDAAVARSSFYLLGVRNHMDKVDVRITGIGDIDPPYSFLRGRIIMTTLNSQHILDFYSPE